MRFNQTVVSAVFDEASTTWAVRTETGDLTVTGDIDLEGTDGNVASYGALDVSYRVSFYVPWIEDVMREHKDTPAGWSEPAKFDIAEVEAVENGLRVLLYLDALVLKALAIVLGPMADNGSLSRG